MSHTFKYIQTTPIPLPQISFLILVPWRHFSSPHHTTVRHITFHYITGTGKTLLAKAVANQTSATFLRVVGSELIQKYLGDGPKLGMYGPYTCICIFTCALEHPILDKLVTERVHFFCLVWSCCVVLCCVILWCDVLHCIVSCCVIMSRSVLSCVTSIEGWIGNTLPS